MQMDFAIFERYVEIALRKHNLDRGDSYDRIFGICWYRIAIKVVLEYIRTTGIIKKKTEEEKKVGPSKTVVMDRNPRNSALGFRSQDIPTSSFTLVQNFNKQIVNSEVWFIVYAYSTNLRQLNGRGKSMVCFLKKTGLNG